MTAFKRALHGGGRFIVLILLIGITFSYAMFQGGFVSWFIFYTLSPFLAYSLLLAFIPIHIKEVQYEIRPSKLERGDCAEVTVSFRIQSWFPFLFLMVREIGVDMGKKDQFSVGLSQIFVVGWRRKFEWKYKLNSVERGVIRFQGVQFTFTDFFGWTVRYKVKEENKTFIVYPKVSEINYKPLQLRFEHGSVQAPFSIVKDTTLATGVRAYQSGDRHSWIHWKSFAKDETLRTKDFEDRQTQDIFLMIDQSAEKNFEYAVDLTASIIQSVIKNHGEITFLSTGEKRRYFPKIKTFDQLAKVIQHLALIKPDAKLSMDAILANEVGLINSATLMIITGELTEQLKQFFARSSKFANGIICFVVTDTNDQYKQSNFSYTNVLIIHTPINQFENVFTEVMKP